MAILGPALANAVQRILGLEGPYPLTSARLVEAFGGRQSITGAHLTPELALGITAVKACVQVLADNVASLPIPVYRRLEGRGKERATDHPLYRILHEEPNPWMTPYQIKETLMGHLLLWGNAFASIERWTSGNLAGQARYLWPLRPDGVERIGRAQNGELRYLYRVPTNNPSGALMDDTGKPGELVEIPQRDMLHIRGLSSNGVVGYSPIALHRESLGLAMAAEEYGSRFFGQDARPGGILKTAGKLGETAANNLKQSWNEAHQGLTGSHRVAVLEDGVEWQAISIPPNDAQFLETRQFQLTEISRIFRVPPHKISDLNRATYSNVDKQEQMFMIDSLRPWLVRWEEQITKDLILPSERSRYFAEFLMEAQWRADIKTRYDAYSKGKQWGWLSTNDIREFENMNPVPDGDMYWMPVNVQAMGGTNVPSMQAAPTEEDEEESVRAFERMLTQVMERRQLPTNGAVH